MEVTYRAAMQRSNDSGLSGTGRDCPGARGTAASGRHDADCFFHRHRCGFRQSKRFRYLDATLRLRFLNLTWIVMSSLEDVRCDPARERWACPAHYYKI